MYTYIRTCSGYSNGGSLPGPEFPAARDPPATPVDRRRTAPLWRPVRPVQRPFVRSQVKFERALNVDVQGSEERNVVLDRKDGGATLLLLLLYSFPRYSSAAVRYTLSDCSRN